MQENMSLPSSEVLTHSLLLSAQHGSLNRYHHSHPLRERARKLSQGILVIR